MNSEKQKPALSGVEWVVPELRFPEFENVGEWEIKKLEDFCDVNPTSKELPKKFVYVDLESVEKGRLLKRNILRLEDAPSRAQRLLQKNDVIFQMVRPYQNNNFFFDIDDEFEYVASTGYALLRAYKSELFLYQYLHTTDFVNRVLAKCTGSNYPAINSKDLSGIRVTVPKNPKEQQKIANCLSSLDEVITAETEKLDLLQNHKKGLLQQLFPQEGETQPQFRFPEFVNDGDWNVITLGDENFASIIMGSSPKSSSYNKNKIGLPLLQGNADIKNRKSKPRIYTTEITKECKVDDILLSVRAPVGTVAKSFHKACIGRGISAIKALNENSQEFLYQWFLSFETSWKDISQGGTFDSVNSNDIKTLQIPLPNNPKEQQKIANCLSSADELIESQHQKIKGLKKHKKGLMQQLFPTVNP